MPRWPAGLWAALRTLAVPGGATASGAIPALPARTVQHHLADLGLLPAAAVSGRFDHRTADAVASFQAARGLAVDGVPGPQTSAALLQG
ncbi:endolysin [Paraconexibacter sp. AEG42_29]|uniref:Endolysin n=2 Tax=Paraconexibacter sp. AEG42_29 TaxID=2997339 RepID=A0AAU7B1U9_9ACTN